MLCFEITGPNITPGIPTRWVNRVDEHEFRVDETFSLRNHYDPNNPPQEVEVNGVERVFQASEQGRKLCRAVEKPGEEADAVVVLLRYTYLSRTVSSTGGSLNCDGGCANPRPPESGRDIRQLHRGDTPSYKLLDTLKEDPRVRKAQYAERFYPAPWRICRLLIIPAGNCVYRYALGLKRDESQGDYRITYNGGGVFTVGEFDERMYPQKTR